MCNLIGNASQKFIRTIVTPTCTLDRVQWVGKETIIYDIQKVYTVLSSSGEKSLRPTLYLHLRLSVFCGASFF